VHYGISGLASSLQNISSSTHIYWIFIKPIKNTTSGASLWHFLKKSSLHHHCSNPPFKRLFFSSS